VIQSAALDRCRYLVPRHALSAFLDALVGGTLSFLCRLFNATFVPIMARLVRPIMAIALDALP